MLIRYQIIELNNISTFGTFIMLLEYDLFKHSYLILWILNQIKYFMQGIRLKGDNLLGQGSSRTTCIRGEFTSCGKWSWQEPCKISLVSAYCHLESVISISQSCSPVLSSGTKHQAFCRGDFSSPSHLPVAIPEYPILPVIRGFTF